MAVSYAVLPGFGEDSFAASSGEWGSLLCVADGCGGLGSRRYAELGDRTGAYLASRLITDAMAAWAEQNHRLPGEPREGTAAVASLQGKLQALLNGFATENGLMGNGGRIVGSMQRVLPSTLCAAVTQSDPEGEACCFVWAGDSRGYALDGLGLHQYTRDDIRFGRDAFECLYCDSSLSNCLSADQPVRLHMRRTRLASPGILICATDGAFGCLPTPMEFEMLLLSTMGAAEDEATWQRKLEMALKRLAHDDATVLCRPRGFESFAQMKRFFEPRIDALKKDYISPVRRHKKDKTLARRRWEVYRVQYDRTEGAQNEQDDWRI